MGGLGGVVRLLLDTGKVEVDRKTDVQHTPLMLASIHLKTEQII
jgi:hypothetical protein